MCDRVLEGHTDCVRSVAVHPDGYIVSGSDDMTVRLWNNINGECFRVLEGHTDHVSSVAVYSDGHIVSGSDDNTVRLWIKDTGDCVRVLEGHVDVSATMSSIHSEISVMNPFL